ncbi:MAG: ribonuclease III [Oscillospiraceae bacterium]|nr:ribonuclease III [Oscillospiraceae bacterium]
MDLLNVKLNDEEIGKITTLGLAHVGDAVYELMVRAYLCRKGLETAKVLHLSTVQYVSAPAQAALARRVIPLFTEEEREIFKRGRNAHVNSVPSKSTVGEYHAATGLEALFGCLYLKGETERLSELFALIAEGGNDAS